MKFYVGLAVFVGALALATAVPDCRINIEVSDFPTEWVNLTEKCTDAVKVQIQGEIGASYTYLEMAAHFSRDTVNRPGFAEFFFNAAREEREHAIKLIEYLSMRGELTKGLKGLTVPLYLKAVSGPWSGVSALSDALELESAVTKNIRELITICEGSVNNEETIQCNTKGKAPHACLVTKEKADVNDYHLVDYLTGVYLEEQHKGQREIAGKLATLKKMELAQGPLAEFLFDKQM